MDNLYLFIIWDKARFCEKRIVDDLSKEFIIQNSFLVRWNKNNFESNLRSFYGHKATNIKEKIRHIGTKPFRVVVVRDKSPQFITHNIDIDDSTLDNINICNKKALYRKWTAGNFRVHSSQNQSETIHDLTVLFGPNYLYFLNSIKKDTIVCKDTLSFNDLTNINEFIQAISNISKLCYLQKNNKIVVFCDCRRDILSSIHFNDGLSNNEYNIQVGEDCYNLVMFGLLENEIPIDYFNNNLYTNLLHEVLNNQEAYINYLYRRGSKPIFLNKYIDFDPISKNSMRKENTSSIVEELKSFIKYLIVRIKSI